MNIGPAEIALPIVLLTMAGMLTYGGVCIFKKDKDKTPTQAPSLTTSQTKEAVEKEKVDKEDIYELPNNPNFGKKEVDIIPLPERQSSDHDDNKSTTSYQSGINKLNHEEEDVPQIVDSNNNQTFNYLHDSQSNFEEINAFSQEDDKNSIASWQSIDAIPNSAFIEGNNQFNIIEVENEIEEEETPEGSSNEEKHNHVLRSSSAESFNGDTKRNARVDSEDECDPHMNIVNMRGMYDGQNGHISPTSKSKRKRLNAKNKRRQYKKGKSVK